jgi:hypothetical protein
MLSELDRRESALGLAPAADGQRDRAVAPDDADSLDVPEFIPPR